jgi:hypothetical protein
MPTAISLLIAIIKTQKKSILQCGEEIAVYFGAGIIFAEAPA